MLNFRSIAATSIITASVAFPIIVSAQTTSITALQQELQSLLAEIAQLQQTATSTPAVVPPTTESSASPSNIICPTIVRTLGLGSSGTDVANLQGFLAQNPLIYPEQSVTGYYGMFTQDAVQRWQTAYNVVSSGSPSTTGYGAIGPRTRAAILASCANSAGTSGAQSMMFTGSNSTSQPICPVAPQPAVSCLGTWSPLTNAKGCTIAWQCSTPLPEATSSIASTASSYPSLSATTGPHSPYVEMFSGSDFPSKLFTIFYGDGISETVTAICPTTAIGQSTSTCGVFTASHVYATGGTYLATIVDSTGTTVASAYVYIEMPVVSSSYGSSGYQISFNASAATSGPPTLVTFTASGLQNSASSYVINFGDGSTGATWSTSGGSASAQQNHTYVSAGIYTANLLDSSGSTQGTIIITINAPGSMVPTITSITPASGPNGTSVTITGTGFTQGTSACGQGCAGGGIVGGTEIYVDGRAVNGAGYTNQTTLTFLIGFDSAGNGTPPLSDSLSIGTHRITVATPYGTSAPVTFKVTR